MIPPSVGPGLEEGPELRRLERKLEAARNELLETTTRTRLLHTPLGSTHAKIIEVQDELAEEVFKVLVEGGKAMSFLAAPGDAEKEADGTLELAQPEDDEVDEHGIARRHRDTKLQTTLPPQKLQARLRAISYDAQTFENEQGVNVLYIALGFLKWYEPSEAERVRYAPLILVPVTLTRASARERFKVAYSGEELGTNLSLQHRLKDGEGITLPELPGVDDLSPNAYFEDVARAVSGIPTWEVQRDRAVLGFFSFAKLLMYRDLEPDRWPLKAGLRDHPIIRGLLCDGFRSEGEPLSSDDSPVDSTIDIATAGHVVDADSSQTLAIGAVSQGKNLVIQGPPGTGKSQTITNLIASAVREGKRVLFIAEKMAALKVVSANLDRIGLGQMCLELHSHKSKKRTVLEDLEQTYQLAAERSGVFGADIADRLRAARDELNAHVRRIHTPLEPSGQTPFEVLSKLARLAGTGLPSPDFRIPNAGGWTRRDIEDRARRVEALGNHVLVMGLPREHPWRGSGLDVVLPEDASRISARAAGAHDAIAKLMVRGENLAARLRLPCETLGQLSVIPTLGGILARAPAMDARALGYGVWTNSRAKISELVEQGHLLAAAHERLDGAIIPEAWEQDFDGVRGTLSAHGQSWFRWLRTEYRQAVRRFRSIHICPPPRTLLERLEVIKTLAAGQRARNRVRALHAVGTSAFGSSWLGEKSDWHLLQAIETWERELRDIDLPAGWRSHLGSLGDVLAFAKDAASLGRDLTTTVSQVRALFEQLSFDPDREFGGSALEAVPLAELRDRLSAMRSASERLQQWCTWRIWKTQAAEVGLGEVVDRLSDGRLEPTRARDSFLYACYETLARQAFTEHHELAEFDGRSHEARVADFQALDHESIRLARQEVAARHVASMPRGGREIGEVGILAREWRKQRRHLPLRQLIKAAGRAIQLIKPVWMMSPMSLAQFVEPGALRFDLVLMDEASQVRPVEALGAIVRGNQVVVVGDDKQLPPTSFFDRVFGDDTEPIETPEFQVGDVESILGLCVAQGIPDRMLRWHYRSQHESLIAVSNLEFYKKLFIVPSAHVEDLGLRFRKVPGVYDRGRSATNPIEARAVAQAVIEHARQYGLSSRFPKGMSLGVGTFSVAQRDAVLDELELLWRQHPELGPFFDPNTPEPFFVKNLESIQGDERDVVFISVGYGPDSDGYVAMGFGPLSAQGGERRLNVLISRARRRCEVFSSISAADIDLARTESIGVRVLKTFLQYAETGQLDRSLSGQRPPDSDFEEDVAGALARLGYEVEHQIGVAGFFVDLGIKNPKKRGSYLLGIECDGATYHSSRSARDRDRLREQVLRDRGWRIHRIWSTDWYRQRQGELKRVIVAIEEAKSLGPPMPPVRGQAPAEQPPRGSYRPPNTTGSPESTAPEPGTIYVETNFVLPMAGIEPHELRLETRIDILLRIVAVEGPVHEDEIGRRYATVCGMGRAGGRIHEAVKAALAEAARQGKLFAEGAFYSVKALATCVPRDRSKTRSLTLRRPDMLPPVEIRTALSQIVGTHIGVEPNAAIVEVARTFGFQRTGTDLRKVIEEHVRFMLHQGAFALKNGRLYTE